MYTVQLATNKIAVNLERNQLIGFSIAGYYNSNGQDFKLHQGSKEIDVKALINDWVATPIPFAQDFDQNLNWRQNLVPIFGPLVDAMIVRIDNYIYTIWLKLKSGKYILVKYNHPDTLAGIYEYYQLNQLNPKQYISVVHQNVLDYNYTI